MTHCSLYPSANQKDETFTAYHKSLPFEASISISSCNNLTSSISIQDNYRKVTFESSACFVNTFWHFDSTYFQYFVAWLISWICVCLSSTCGCSLRFVIPGDTGWLWPTSDRFGSRHHSMQNGPLWAGRHQCRPTQARRLGQRCRSFFGQDALL